jgi:uncharacterized protein with von Willebrand factor type A (vWA) domain
MKSRLLGFIDALRESGVPCTVSESLDAARAAAVAGVERTVFRECLAATLVKDHGDRPAFDEVFDRYFGVPSEANKRRREKRRGEEEGRGGEGEGRGRAQPAEGTRGGEHERRESVRPAPRPESRRAERLAARRALLERPFEDMDARDIEEIRELVAELGQRFRARWARRMRRANLGRLDMRRTIRRSMGRGGVPVELLHRRPRPGKIDLLALVDLSYSTATAAEFLLALLAPARRFFRRVRLLGYVDAPAEIGYERGHVAPHEPLDLNARSDFGRVLVQIVQRYGLQMSRNTLVLVLGDARNNRRPPRADLLAEIRDKVRAVVWLNPEKRDRWDTGDSVMKTYARYCDVVLNAWNLRTLLQVLAALARRAA